MSQEQKYALDITKFIDHKMGYYIKIMIYEYISNTSYARTSSKNISQKKLNEIYTKLFSSVSIKDIDTDFLGHFLKGKTYKEVKYSYRLIIFLLKNKVINNEMLKRMLDLEHKLYYSGNIEDFWCLMESKIYDQLKNENSFIQSKELLFINLNDISIFNNADLELLDEYLMQLKTDSSCQPAVRLQKCYSYKNIVRYLFQDKKINEIKRIDIINLLNSTLPHGSKKCGDIFSLLEFIDKRGCLNDDLKQFMNFKEYINSSYKTEKVKELLGADRIEQYILVRDKKNEQRLHYIDIPYEYELFDIMKSFITNSGYRNANINIFISEFYKSMGNERIKNVTDLSFTTYYSTVLYFAQYGKKSYYSYIFAFYNYCYNYCRVDFFEKNNLSIKILWKPGLAQKLVQGYEVVRYNPINPVPDNDKWILCYSKDYESNTEHSISEALDINFEQIRDAKHKSWIKYYFWKAQKGIKTKRSHVQEISTCLNYITDLRAGRELSIYYKKKNVDENMIDVSEVMALKNRILQNYDNIRTAVSIIYDFRVFLKFLYDTDKINIGTGVFYYLQTQTEIKNTSHAIPDDHLNLLNKYMLKQCEQGIQNELYYTIFYLALETEIRISEIVSLHSDCVMESPGKRNEYIIRLRKKDETTEFQETAITTYVKRHIDHVLDITKKLREFADSNMKTYLFLAPSTDSAVVRVITRENFRIYLKKCCESVAIPMYTAANLRDTHMTKAREFKILHKLSDMEHSVLTGHKTQGLDMRNYVDMSVESMMEALHGVSIGNVSITGTVQHQLPDNIASEKNEVSSGCGYCCSPYCEDMSYLDCMLCKYFVTTPSRFHYFEEQVKVMDNKIKSSTLPHDKEDYINIKRLLVSYMAAIKNCEGNNDTK